MDNLAIIKAFAAAGLAGDIDTMTGLMHADFVVRQAPGLPYRGAHRGAGGFLAMFAAMQAAWRQLSLSQIGVIGAPEGDTFALHMRVEGISAQGEAISSEVFERWVVRDGKVAEIQPFYWDTAALAAQLEHPSA